jgi:hypothetical protein
MPGAASDYPNSQAHHLARIDLDDAGDAFADLRISPGAYHWKVSYMAIDEMGELDRREITYDFDVGDGPLDAVHRLVATPDELHGHQTE